MTRVLLTGAGGFFGAHVLRHLLMETDWEIACPVTFRHHGHSGRIASSLEGNEEWYQRVQVIMHDLTAPFPDIADRVGRCDYVLALAAESHVDRSITSPVPFIRNNTDVMLTTLEYARDVKPEKVIVFSTDEVYGALAKDGPPHPEWSPIVPSNPYSASKAAQEAIAISWWRTYGVPVVIVNSMNLIGQMQDPEKYVPETVSMIYRGCSVRVHGTEQDTGSRFYIHARAVADALLFILRLPAAAYPAARRPDRYNVVGDERLTNLQLAEMVAEVMGVPLDYELMDFHAVRPGHDAHYGLDGSRLAALGWKSLVPFRQALAKTIHWYLAHPEWLI